MLVRFTKQPPASASDTLTCVRPDGTATTTPMPRQGILPHDAFHFAIETTLGWHDAYFGAVARGAGLEELTKSLHSPSGKWTKNTQAQQSEALIECLEANQWGGSGDPSEFATRLLAACRRRGVAPPDITASELENVRRALREFGAAWRPLAPGQSLERTF